MSVGRVFGQYAFDLRRLRSTDRERFFTVVLNGKSQMPPGAACCSLSRSNRSGSTSAPPSIDDVPSIDEARPARARVGSERRDEPRQLRILPASLDGLRLEQRQRFGHVLEEVGLALRRGEKSVGA